MDLYELVVRTLQLGGSDIFIIPGSPIVIKCLGRHVQLSENKLMPSDTEILIREIYEMSANRSLGDLFERGDDDFSFSIQRLGRFRCNAYRQRGSLAAVLRVVAVGLPDCMALGIPESVMRLSEKKQGIIIVTGPAGNGKTTTLACIIDKINHGRMGHIITIEDPIEFLHPHARCIVSQREVRADTYSFADALRAALRQASDVIFMGELPDSQVIETALTAAESGRLILSAMHTLGAQTTIDRIIDQFPNHRQQMRNRLAMQLEAVVSQQLIPTTDGSIHAVFEVMHVTPEIRTLIRDGETDRIEEMIRAGAAHGMRSMDLEILQLYSEGRISRENALLYAVDPETVHRFL